MAKITITAFSRPTTEINDLNVHLRGLWVTKCIL